MITFQAWHVDKDLDLMQVVDSVGWNLLVGATVETVASKIKGERERDSKRTTINNQRRSFKS